LGQGQRVKNCSAAKNEFTQIFLPHRRT
jgi:hypothetical protein